MIDSYSLLSKWFHLQCSFFLQESMILHVITLFSTSTKSYCLVAQPFLLVTCTLITHAHASTTCLSMSSVTCPCSIASITCPCSIASITCPCPTVSIPWLLSHVQVPWSPYTCLITHAPWPLHLYAHVPIASITSTCPMTFITCPCPMASNTHDLHYGTCLCPMTCPCPMASITCTNAHVPWPPLHA